MKVCVVIFVLYLLNMNSEQVLALSSKAASKAANAAKSATCPADLACDKLQGGDCTVTVDNFVNNIVNKTWLAIYAVAFPPELLDFDKVKLRWTQSGATATRETRIAIPGTCLPLEEFNFTIAENTDCGIELNEVNNGPRIDTWCSQNTTEYLVTYVCLNRAGQDCIEGIIALLIPENREECVETVCDNDYVGEPNLTNLPKGKINQDWFKFICKYFPDAPLIPTDKWKGNASNMATTSCNDDQIDYFGLRM